MPYISWHFVAIKKPLCKIVQNKQIIKRQPINPCSSPITAYIKSVWDSGSQSSFCFEDSLDFISWYMLKTTKINKVPLSNVYLQYLNYHEGWGGYKRGSYNKNSALKSVARKVERQSNLYKQQLKDCRL